MRIFSVVAFIALMSTGAQAGTACKNIADPMKRLACYDDLEKSGALQSGEAVQSDKAPPAESDPAFFGVPITRSPNDSLNSVQATADQTVARDDEGLVESITSPVVEYSVSANRMVTVVLANGQVWRQVSGRELWLKDEAAENVVKISRTILGGFSMTVNGKNDVAIVKRLDGKRAR